MPEEDQVLRKLDGGLRRLLRMNEEEIVQAVESMEARIARRLEEIRRLEERLPPKRRSTRSSSRRRRSSPMAYAATARSQVSWTARWT